MDKTFVIIDGNSLINRAYFAMQRPMITKEGIYTQGIYGFLNMLTKIKEDYEPGYIAVTFDLKAPTFRHLEYAEYKAGRKTMPVELAMEMPILKDILHAMNIKTLELSGFEADDLIGTLSRFGEEEGMSPLIITGDRDALQLASNITNVLITKKGISEFEIYDYDKMIERYNLTPTQFIDLKGIMGDSSDNIPGIPGIGEKGGIELLTQFGSIEEMLNHTEEISKKGMRAKVEENAQLALMSKRLATINRFVPIEFEKEEYRVVEPNYEELVGLYKKLEFNSFLKKLHYESKEELVQVKEINVESYVISSENDLQKLDVFKNGEVYLKVFGDNKHVVMPEIEAIFVMDYNHAILIDNNNNYVNQTVSKLNELGLKLIGHDIKNDIFQLMMYGYSNFEVSYDTAIAEYVLDVSKSKYELNAMSIDMLSKSLPEIETEQTGMFVDISETYLKQGINFGTCVLSIMDIQKNRIKEEKLEKVLYDVEIPLIEVLAAMERDGIYTDVQYIDEFGLDLKDKIKELEEKIYSLSGEEFNIKSPQQLGEILFEKLGLTSGKKTKKGYSTSAEILEKIKDEHEIVPLILKYRNLTKLDSTYVEGLKPLVSNDGRIHAHFMQTVTQTGRISCTEPNLQNIPIRQELGRKLRQAFLAKDGYTLVGADYSQIELRVMAHLSQDPSLLEAFNTGLDIHKMTASRVLGVPMDEVTSTDRSRAKAVNFGVIYGMSGFGLSDELNISRKEAEKYISDYFEKHGKVKEYLDRQIKNAKATGYSETILGRKRAIPEIAASNFMVRQLGERLAMNSPIQGTAADIIKLAMIDVYNELKLKHPDSRLILQVHDELIIETKDEELEEVKELLIRNMENAMKLTVNLVSELNFGKSWYDLK